MKVYFTAAVSQKDQYGDIYRKIVDTLQNIGYNVQHDNPADVDLQALKNRSNDEKVDHYRKVLKTITQADLIVVEASFPSTLNIGHEITLALEKGKPVIVLFKKGFHSSFLGGLTSEKLFLVEYTDETLVDVLKDAVEYARDQVDTRFNFFISPRHVSYLDWVAQTKRIPRSVYLRQLIETDREQNFAEYEQS